MPTRNVVLTEHQAALVENLVIRGRYQNASEVVRDALRLHEVSRHRVIEELRTEIAKGWDGAISAASVQDIVKQKQQAARK